MAENFYRKISEKYRAEGIGSLSKEEVEAYVTARMPATLAAAGQVLSEVVGRIPCEVKSFLDMGAGTGAGLLAAKEHFPAIEQATLVERNPQMIAKGKELVEASWVEAKAQGYIPTPHDLVLFSYSLGEMDHFLEVLEKAWSVAQIIVVVEAGTPRGFNAILQVRKKLIQLGGQMIAPCPHVRKCPMEGNDWCHFSARLSRSKEHRQLKGAERGWEDEKYSYVAFAKEKTSPAEARIVRHPQKKSGHVVLQLCTDKGIEQVTVSKKQGALYKRARKAKWGDYFLNRL